MRSETAFYSAPFRIKVTEELHVFLVALPIVTVVVEQRSALLIVRLKELLVGMMSFSCALPQYLTRAMLMGDFMVTENSSLAESCLINGFSCRYGLVGFYICFLVCRFGL